MINTINSFKSLFIVNYASGRSDSRTHTLHMEFSAILAISHRNLLYFIKLNKSPPYMVASDGRHLCSVLCFDSVNSTATTDKSVASSPITLLPSFSQRVLFEILRYTD